MATQDSEKKTVLSEVREFTNELKVRRDELMSPLYFQELLRLAEVTCLTTLPDYPETQPPTGEAAVVARLGSRGLKVALELSTGVVTEHHRDKTYSSEDAENEGDRVITVSSPIRHARDFASTTDFDILAKTEAFGSQLIEESFRTLGQDAYSKAAEFAQATTAEEQMAIIHWLDARLFRMSRSPEGESTDVEERYYHPARISPKFIGIYPNHQLEPTCLSVSIIAAGFFKRAGVEAMLHGDVAETGAEASASYTGYLIEKLPKTLEKLGVSLPDAAHQSAIKVYDQVTAYEHRPDAHHVALYVRLVDGTWAQFDSNYRATTHLRYEPTVEDLNMCWQKLKALAPIAPNIEISSHFFNDEDFDYASLAQYIVKKQNISVINELTAAVENELDSDTDEQFGERIFQLIENIFFNDSETQEDDFLKMINQVVKSSEVITYGTFKESHLHNAFYELFNKYVLWGESPDTVLKKIQNDVSYRHNRLEDITALPFLMAISIARDSFIDAPDTPGIHSSVELGLPEQRIGLATLSDFAVYTNSPLSPSFWLSHWPGSVSIIENLDRASHSSFDDSLLFNNLAHHEVHPLTSRRNYDIIKQFIEVRSQAKQEGQDHGEAGQQ